MLLVVAYHEPAEAWIGLEQIDNQPARRGRIQKPALQAPDLILAGGEEVDVLRPPIDSLARDQRGPAGQREPLSLRKLRDESDDSPLQIAEHYTDAPRCSRSHLAQAA